MKLTPISLILLCCLALLPLNLAAAAVAPFQPMSSAGHRIQGVFNSALNNAVTPGETRVKMSSTSAYIPEGSFEGVCDAERDTAHVKVLVKIKMPDNDPLGMEEGDANLLTGFSGFPGFYPGVSPDSNDYHLATTTVLSAPNFIYLPRGESGNQIRYRLVSYAGGGQIPSGSATVSGQIVPGIATPADGMTTMVAINLGKDSTGNSITWKYRKQIRVSVKTRGVDTNLDYYDLEGDTTAGSAAVTNLSSTTGLEEGMLVYGNGIPEGTTIDTVDSASKVTLSAAATQNFNQKAGQRLTFVPTLPDASADPRECLGADPQACVDSAAATKSGVHFYDASNAALIVLTTKQSFDDSETRTMLQTLPLKLASGTRSQITGGSGEKWEVLTATLAEPLVITWSYDETRLYVIGQPILVDEALDKLPAGCTVDYDTKPVITLTSQFGSIDSSFVWSWDNSDPQKQHMSYFPVDPGNISFTIRWGITCNADPKIRTFDVTGMTALPEDRYIQKHIVGAPVNLAPPGAVNTFSEIKYHAAGAEGLQGVFKATTADTRVLCFSTPAVLPHPSKPGTAFIVVKSEEMPSIANIDHVPSWPIGKKIVDPVNHTDPEKATKTGYLFHPGGVFDGAGPDKAIDRETRIGAIIPVNETKATDPLVVVWYRKGLGDLGWPVKPIKYTTVWPESPDNLVIGEGIKISENAKPRARVYNQPDGGVVGLNPNEEHALLTGGTLYALRDDLNNIMDPPLSKPYVLLKYFDTANNEWAMDVYKVIRKSSYTYTVDAGQPIVPPLPASFQVPPDSGMKIVGGEEVGGQWHLLDHKGGHWAKAANWSAATTPEPAAADKSKFVMQWYYYMRNDFYWPVKSGYVAKPEGKVIPFLSIKAPGENYVEDEKPIDVTYITRWPTELPNGDPLPELPVGDTLTTARNGLPDLYNFQSAEVIFDQNVYEGNGPLAKLYAPERYLYVNLEKLPAGIKTEIGPGGVLTFPELPYAIQQRLFFDSTPKRLGFKGAWIANEGEEPWLLPNLMTNKEMDTIKKLSPTTDSTWETAIEALRTKGQNPNGVDMNKAQANPYNAADETGTWKGKWGINLGLDNKYIGEGRTVPLASAPQKGMLVTAITKSPSDTTSPESLIVNGMDSVKHQVTLSTPVSTDCAPLALTFSNGVTLKGKFTDGTVSASNCKSGTKYDIFSLSTVTESSISIAGEKNALTAGMAQGEGYVVIAENNLDSLQDAPVKLHVIKVVKAPVFQGIIKAIKSKNVFDEKLTLHYTGDFGGEPENFNFDWYYQPVLGDIPSLPCPDSKPECSIHLATSSWQRYITSDNPTGTGLTDITISGASPLTLSDNWFVARYYYKTAWPLISSGSNPATPATPHADLNNWSAWSGANIYDTPMLAVGWIKRVVDGLNPLESRVTDFRNNATNTTVSMLSQFGSRFEGAVAMNSSADNLNSMGLISAYETVLNRGREFSIDAVSPQNYGPTNDALLNITSRLATFYLALGNEAYADAVDPTIGFSTKSAEYGNMAPSVFAFQNQLDSLLEEELALMRGRDDSAGSTKNSPYYNRLIWNFTQGEGEVAYAQNYNITDQDKSGLINAGDAKIMYPQGHGDAWGNYLQSISYYYQLLGHPYFSWEPRVEFVLVAGQPIMVDYLDERKFASIAAARAKTGAEILDLTYRKYYTDDPAGQWQGYKDSDHDRAWGVDDWARRAGQAAYFDWVTANAILPQEPPKANRKHYVSKRYKTYDKQGVLVEDKEVLVEETLYVDGTPATADAKAVPPIQQIDRSKVPELNSIASQFLSMQAKITEVDSGINPLGLVKGVVPFDIDPAMLDAGYGFAGQTHFEQVYERAEKALNNAFASYDYANGYTQRLRQNQDTLEEFKKNLTDQERDYKNRLIEIFGYPYGDDIGPGKTYPDGYSGPDIFHYNYVDSTELTGKKNEGFKTYSRDYTILDTFLPYLGGLTTLTAPGDSSQRDSSSIHAITYNIATGAYWQVKDPSWTLKRRAPGRIQQALSELIVAEANLNKARIELDCMIGGIEKAKIDLEQRFRELKSQLTYRNVNEGIQSGFDATIVALHATSLGLKRLSIVADNTTEAMLEGMCRIVNLDGGDYTFGARGGISVSGAITSQNLAIAADFVDGFEFAAEKLKDRLQAQADLRIEASEANFEIWKLVQDLNAMTADVDPKLLETYQLQETLQQAVGNYQAALAEGLRLWDELEEKRKQAAAEVQEYRFQDLGFRVFRNEAIQKYRAQFDLAAKYVYLAATAYDYETNLLGTASGAGRKFLSEIASQRTLGVLNNGVPQAGFPGLADVMARLNQNFAVYKTQLGFNNPQTETTPFSLRTELFRIRSDASFADTDTDGKKVAKDAWQNILKDKYVDDLWQIPEFKRFCRPFAPENAGPQPGIVIKFPTTVTYGKNFFGWPLSGGDSAYSTSNFATKIRSVGLWFENYNNSGLSSTPRVYLVPTGLDVLRSPTGDGFATREWQVRDQKIPVPFPIGDSDLKNPSFIPASDSLSDDMAGIRRVSDFRAYPYSGEFIGDQTTSDSRLVGRSVWNTQWMLIIPGSTLLFNKDVGLNTFIDSVDDIKLFFQTYAYSGN